MLIKDFRVDSNVKTKLEIIFVLKLSAIFFIMYFRIGLFFLIFQDILKDINARVAEKERKQRLFEIYNKIDPKANLVQLGTGRKFKKSDILLADRKLMFEGMYEDFFLISSDSISIRNVLLMVADFIYL